jgi:hypothetical protein
MCFQAGRAFLQHAAKAFHVLGVSVHHWHVELLWHFLIHLLVVFGLVLAGSARFPAVCCQGLHALRPQPACMGAGE